MGEEIIRAGIPLALYGWLISCLHHRRHGAGNALPYTPETRSNARWTERAVSSRVRRDVINFGASAGLTSLNAAAIALPRELFSQSRDGMLPESLSRVTPRTHSPLRAITAFFALLILLVLANFDQDFYGLMAAIGIQLVTAAICIGCVRLKAKYPEMHTNAYIVFPGWLLWACTIATVAVTIGTYFLSHAVSPLVAPFVQHGWQMLAGSVGPWWAGLTMPTDVLARFGPYASVFGPLVAFGLARLQGPGRPGEPLGEEGFEIGQRLGPHGHRIAGGVSRGEVGTHLQRLSTRHVGLIGVCGGAVVLIVVRQQRAGVGKPGMGTRICRIPLDGALEHLPCEEDALLATLMEELPPAEVIVIRLWISRWRLGDRAPLILPQDHPAYAMRRAVPRSW